MQLDPKYRGAAKPMTAIAQDMTVEMCETIMQEYDAWEVRGTLPIEAKLREYTQAYMDLMGMSRSSSFIQLAEAMHSAVCRTLAWRYVLLRRKLGEVSKD